MLSILPASPEALAPWRDMCLDITRAGLDLCKGRPQHISVADVKEALCWIMKAARECPDTDLGGLLEITAELVLMAVEKPETRDAVRSRLGETLATLTWGKADEKRTA